MISNKPWNHRSIKPPMMDHHAVNPLCNHAFMEFFHLVIMASNHHGNMPHAMNEAILSVFVQACHLGIVQLQYNNIISINIMQSCTMRTNRWYTWPYSVFLSRAFFILPLPFPSSPSSFSAFLYLRHLPPPFPVFFISVISLLLFRFSLSPSSPSS